MAPILSLRARSYVAALLKSKRPRCQFRGWFLTGPLLNVARSDAEKNLGPEDDTGEAVYMKASVVFLCAVALALGVLIGRWLLPNNGPCTLDYGLVAAWIGTAAAVGLVFVGWLAAAYAYRTARAALDTLALEREPILLAEIDDAKFDLQAPPQLAVQINLRDDNALLIAPLMEPSEIGLLRIKIRNVGRGAALNAKVPLLIKNEERGQSTILPCYIQGLESSEVYRVWIQNRTLTEVLSLTANEATADSSTTPGVHDAAIRLYVSTAMPFSIVPA